MALLHGLGSEVLIPGVEEEGLASLAHDARADLAQGYYFGMPQAHTEAEEIEEESIPVLSTKQARPSPPQ